MSVELVELAAGVLRPVLDEVVFLGGASISLWITDPGAPPPRPTADVDVVLAAVTTRQGFYGIEARLRSLGFEEDREAGIICRFRHRASGLILDAMPADPSILGFENRWQAASIPHAVERTLPSGARIRAVSPPYLMATKVEAFKSRGLEDFLVARDFADLIDLIELVDGREELVGEVARAEPEYPRRQRFRGRLGVRSGGDCASARWGRRGRWPRAAISRVSVAPRRASPGPVRTCHRGGHGLARSGRPAETRARTNDSRCRVLRPPGGSRRARLRAGAIGPQRRAPVLAARLRVHALPRRLHQPCGARGLPRPRQRGSARLAVPCRIGVIVLRFALASAFSS